METKKKISIWKIEWDIRVEWDNELVVGGLIDTKSMKPQTRYLKIQKTLYEKI